MTGNNACNTDWTDNEHTNDFRSNTWVLDYDKAVSVAGNVLGDGRSVNARERMERLRSLALTQLSDTPTAGWIIRMIEEYSYVVVTTHYGIYSSLLPSFLPLRATLGQREFL